MLVILRENVENLGIVGDVVNVAPGYARNYLIPNQLVGVANERNVAAVEHQKKILEKKRLSQKAAAEELSKKISEFSCTIARKVSDKGHLFGSVSGHDIYEALTKGGFTIPKSGIQLKDHIKSLGVHTVDVKLAPEVTGQVKVWVVKEE